MPTQWTGRGYLEVTEALEGYELNDWSEHGDSGAYLGWHATLQSAVAAARAEQAGRPERRLVILGEVVAEHRP